MSVLRYSSKSAMDQTKTTTINKSERRQDKESMMIAKEDKDLIFGTIAKKSAMERIRFTQIEEILIIYK